PAKVFRSPPPQNIRPAPASTTARTARSSSQRSVASIRSRASSTVIELAAAGRLRVRCATPSRTTRSIVSYDIRHLAGVLVAPNEENLTSAVSRVLWCCAHLPPSPCPSPCGRGDPLPRAVQRRSPLPQ